MITVLARLLPAIIAIALVLAACGDSGGDTTTSQPVDAGATSSTMAAAPDTTAATTEPGEGAVDDPSDTTLPEGLELDPNQPKPVPLPGEVQPGEVQEAMLGFAELAAEDLAQRLGVPRDDIVVVTAEAVVWPDSSLGCPLPDMAYLQVLTDGYRIILDVDGGLYSYHGGGTRLDPFYCESPTSPAQGVAPGGGDS